MEFNLRFDGFAEFSKHLAGLSDFGKAMDGKIADLRFNPDDPASVEAAVTSIEAEIDRRLAPFGDNATAVAMAEDLKRRYAAGIRNVRRPPEAV